MRANVRHLLYTKDPVPRGGDLTGGASAGKRIGHKEEAERVQVGKEEIRVPI